MVRPTVNSEKHFVHYPIEAVASGVRVNKTVLSVSNALGSADAVRVGSTVKAIYVELWANGATASKTGFACITKSVGLGDFPTFAETANMGAYPNKKNVFETHQGIMPSGGNQMAFFRHWIKIPKGKQRMGLGDGIKITISGTGTVVNFCGFAVFKEYY